MAYGETRPTQNALLSAVPLLQSCWIWTQVSPLEDASNVTGWQIRGDSAFISFLTGVQWID
jgi:hypothetical protein